VVSTDRHAAVAVLLLCLSALAVYLLLRR